MSGELYEVLVLGPVEATPTAEARLAAVLAGLNGAPLMTVAQGLSEKSLSMGSSLDRVAAESLMRQLQQLGALTSIRRTATGAFPPSGALTPPPGTAFRHAGTPAGALQGLTPQSAPGSGLGSTLMGASPGSGLRSGGMGASPPSGQGLRPLGSLRPENATPGNLPAVPGRVPTDGMGHRVPTGAGFNLTEPSSRPRGSAKPMFPSDPAPPPAAPAAPADPFSSPDGGALNLELDRGRDRDRDRNAEDRPTTASSSVAGASGLFNPKLIAAASKSGSGLDLAGSKQSTVERCSKHGLLYDTAKSSACRKCLGEARQALVEKPGTLRSNPGRRALMGLLFALVLGFLPAAYYARVPGAAEVNKLRTEQQELSKGLGNEKTIRRFDEIDELVLASRRLSMRNTLIIWITASGVLLGVWYKAT
jgi:hypothetical protein